MRKYIYILLFFMAFIIFLDELSYTWWKRLNPGSEAYSLLKTPQPLFGFGGDRPLNTLKTSTNRFYPTR